MPKEHHAIMPLIPENEIAHLAEVSKALSQTLLKAFKAQGTTIFVANGMAAGQKAQHFMIHIIPRMEKDNIGIMIPENKMKDSDLEEIYRILKKRVNELFGLKVVEAEFEEKSTEKQTEEKEEPIQKEPKQTSDEANLDDISNMLLGK
jgi:diadenosine tetraphosphate (Ap4A) HIT family hydrolase